MQEHSGAGSQLGRGAEGAGSEPTVQEAEPTCDSAHRAFHEVASIPSHVSAEAIANQVDIAKRKIILLLWEVTEVTVSDVVVPTPQGHQQFNNSMATRKSQGNRGQTLARAWPALLAVRQRWDVAREGEGKRTLWHLKC